MLNGNYDIKTHQIFPGKYLSDDVSSTSEMEPNNLSLHGGGGGGDRSVRMRSWSSRGSPTEMREENARLKQQLTLIVQNVLSIQSDVMVICLFLI